MPKRKSEVTSKEDVCTIAGPYIGAILQQMFLGVPLPVKNREDLLAKAGADRLLYLSHPKYGNCVYSICDVLDAIPGVESFMPVPSVEAAARKMQRLHEIATKKGLPTLFERIGVRHLRKQLAGRKPPCFDVPTVKVPPVTVKKTVIEEFKKRVADKKNLPPNGAFKDKDQELLTVVFVDMVSDFMAALLGAQAAASEENAIVEAENAGRAAIAAEEAADQAEEAANRAAGDNMQNVQQAVTDAHTAWVTAAAQANLAANAAIHSRGEALRAQTGVATEAAARAEAAAAEAAVQAARAEEAYYRALALSEVNTATISVHVLEDNTNWCSGTKDVPGVSVNVTNIRYPEISAKSGNTNQNGRVVISGRFAGNSEIVITIEKNGHSASVNHANTSTYYETEIVLPGYNI